MVKTKLFELHISKGCLDYNRLLVTAACNMDTTHCDTIPLHPLKTSYCYFCDYRHVNAFSGLQKYMQRILSVAAFSMLRQGMKNINYITDFQEVNYLPIHKTKKNISFVILSFVGDTSAITVLSTTKNLQMQDIFATKQL